MCSTRQFTNHFPVSISKFFSIVAKLFFFSAMNAPVPIPIITAISIPFVYIFRYIICTINICCSFSHSVINNSLHSYIAYSRHSTSIIHSFFQLNYLRRYASFCLNITRYVGPGMTKRFGFSKILWLSSDF